MRRARHLAIGSALVLALSGAACGDPPEKEMQQAQGAIDAARAAGADRYATEEYAAAQDALKKANEAVTARDYRQALNYALDSRERAQTAAKEAADHKATARTDADKALGEADGALRDAQQRLKAAETRRVPARVIAAPKKVVIDGEHAVQEARTAFSQGDYFAVLEKVQPLTAGLRAASHDLEIATAPPAKGRRR